jgi:hypothetical protein
MSKQGAPLGNTNASRGRRWAHAVERAMNAYPDRAVSLEINRGIDNAAHEFVAQLMAAKDLGFFKEFGDRIDGKPAQAVTLSGDEDNPVAIATIERKIVRPNTNDSNG